MELSDAAAETSVEMHRHSRGQLRHGTAMTAEEKRRQSKERPYADLQRLGKAERWQGYVRRGLAAQRNSFGIDETGDAGIAKQGFDATGKGFAEQGDTVQRRGCE